MSLFPSPSARIVHSLTRRVPSSTHFHLPSRPFIRPSSSSPARLFASTSRLPFAQTMPTQTGPPAKKMLHLQSVQALPSLYPDFRTVLWTGESSQLVVMTIPVGGEIGEEVHEVDQHLIFTSGICKAIVAGEEKEVKGGDMVVVPQGTKHNFINTGPTPLCLFTVYAPAEHDPASVHKTKEEGDELEDAGKDEAPAWAKKQ